MKIADFILNSTKKLAKSGYDAPRTDTLAILENVLQKNQCTFYRL